MQNAIPSKQRTKKVVLTSIAVGATGVLAYFGWKYWNQLKKKRVTGSTNFDNLFKDSSSLPELITSMPANQATAAAISTTKKASKAKAIASATSSTNQSDFPLHKGSKGEKVRQLQEALMAKYGKSILPKYGSDGDFGSETAMALKKAGLPTSIDASTFNVLVAITASPTDSFGKNLYMATLAKDFNSALTILKKITSTDDYTTANEEFKTYRIAGVRQTIVNGLLNTFTSDSQKQQIKFELLRIGLQYDGSKWSLSGLGGVPIITNRPSVIWVSQSEKKSVPANVVLGNEVSKKQGFTLFENQGRHFLVLSQNIRYL